MTTPTSTLVVGGIIAWGIYRRVRRNIGRQPLRTARIIISLVVLSLVTILVLAGALAFPKLLLGVACGILAGGVLGFVGLRLTKFETTDQGHFFVPNMYIGLALSLLLAGRLLYRLSMVHDASEGSPRSRLLSCAAFSKSADLFHPGPDHWLLLCLSRRPVCSFT